MSEHANDQTIPADMKAWDGGNAAPADWDGGQVMMRNGRMSSELSRGLAADGRPVSGRWHWETRQPLPASDDIIAYTALTPLPPAGADDGIA